MIKLYGFDTINTLKVMMFLQESGLPFDYAPINIRTGDQHTPAFRAVNPAGKVPVIVDGETVKTESNSILLDLAQQTGWGLTSEAALHDELVAWLFYQASTQGPYFGQIEYWTRLAKTPNPDAEAQYRSIAARVVDHVNERLGDRDFICGDTYTIADIALYPWFHMHEHLGLSLVDHQPLADWIARVGARPATQDAIAFFGAKSLFS